MYYYLLWYIFLNISLYTNAIMYYNLLRHIFPLYIIYKYIHVLLFIEIYFSTLYNIQIYNYTNIFLYYNFYMKCWVDSWGTILYFDTWIDLNY